MNPLENLSRSLEELQREKSLRVHAVDPLFRKAEPKTEKFDQNILKQLADRKCALDKLASLLLTDERPKDLDPESIISLWEFIGEITPTFLPKVPTFVVDHLKTVSEELKSQLALDYTPEWISLKISNLKPGESFRLLLPHTTINGKKELENLAVYKRNQNGTFNITLYNSGERSWEEQGGEFGLTHEKAYPFRFYADVPLEAMFGNSEPVEISEHARSVVKAIQVKNKNNKAIVAAFNPLEIYRSEPTSLFARLAGASHAHPLKGINTFYYDTICEAYFKEGTSAKSKSPLQCYKAINCLARLAISAALPKYQESAEYQELDEIYSAQGLAEEAIKATGLMLTKQKRNPFCEELYPQFAGTLNSLKIAAMKKIYAYASSHKALEETSQIELAMQCKAFSRKRSEFPYPDLGDRVRLPVFSYYSSTHPKVSEEFINWLGFGTSFSEADENKIVIINSLVRSLPLPTASSIWMALDHEQKLDAITLINQFASQLSSSCFDSNKRFALDSQNSAAKLLIIAHALTASLEKKNVLADFVPALREYRALTESPFFHVGSYDSWQDRKEILDYLDAEKLSGKKEMFFFDNQRAFSETGDYVVAKAILSAYPEILNFVEKEIKKAKYDKFDPSILERTFFEVLISSRDFQELSASGLKNLMRIALNTHLLADPTARPQNGSFYFSLSNGWSISFRYGKNLNPRKDFLSEGRPLDERNFDPALERNLLGKSQLIQTQNEVLDRFAPLKDENAHISFPFEQAAANPRIMLVSLLSELKNKPTLLKDPKIRAKLERYFFKPVVDESGKEFLPLLEELKQNPDTFSKLFDEFLTSAFYAKVKSQSRLFSHEDIYLYDLAIQLYSFSKKMPCPALEAVLTSRINNWKNEWTAAVNQKEVKSYPRLIQMELNLLKIYELEMLDDSRLEASLKDYLILGNLLEIHLTYSDFKLSTTQADSYKNLKYRLLDRFDRMIKENPQKMEKLLTESVGIPGEKWSFEQFPFCSSSIGRTFDLFGLSFEVGQKIPIDPRILKNPEFKKLFGNRVNSWSGFSKIYFFKDPLTDIEYCYHSEEKFPEGLYRTSQIFRESYLSYSELLKLPLPDSVIQEGIFWIDSMGKISCYYSHDPEKLWLQTDRDGYFIFKDGAERGMHLELVDRSKDSQGKIGPFEMRHRSFEGNYIHRGIETKLQEHISFPFLKMPDGNPLVFRRKPSKYSSYEFVQETPPFRKFEGDNFKGYYYNTGYNTNRKGSPLILSCIKVSTKSEVGDVSNFEIILPFQKHISDPHSHSVHAEPLETGVNAPSYFQGIETISIKLTKEQRLSPKEPLEILFASYLSLLGKDYEGALSLIQKIRPGYRFNEKELQVLKWMIDSKEDAHDHSSTAAAIKLRAYMLLAGQYDLQRGIFSKEKLPKTNLEEIYLDYLKHPGAMSKLFKLNPEQELGILLRGFKLFPSSPINQASFELRAEELKGHASKVELHEIPKKEAKSLLELWQKPCLKADIPYKNNYSILEGVSNLEYLPSLIPGADYPPRAFGFHYLFLKSDRSTFEKWQLIYQLETVNIPDHLKAALMIAFNEGINAPKLPEFDSSLTYKKMEAFEAWLETLLKPVSDQSTQLPENKEPNRTFRTVQQDAAKLGLEVQRKNPEEAVKAIEVEDAFSEKVMDAISQHSDATPQLIIEAFRNYFASQQETVDILASEAKTTPFVEDAGKTAAETEEYTRIWQRGAQELKESQRYPLADPREWKLFSDFIERYKSMYRAPKDLKLEIKRQLNHKPVERKRFEDMLVGEASQQIAAMNLDDAFKVVFLPTAEKKLNYLRKRNPFFTEKDLEILNTLTLNLLEFKVLDQTFQQIKSKLLPVIEHIIDPAIRSAGLKWSEDGVIEKYLPNWHDDKNLAEVWQEIGELLNPYEDHEEPLQKRMERLLFEKISGYRIRKEQLEVLHAVVQKIFAEPQTESSLAVVFQLIMGGGKTSVILAQLAKFASERGRVPLFVAHHSQYASAKGNLSRGQFKRLNQDVIEINFTREELGDVGILKYINTQLELAEKKKRLLLMPTNFLEMLQLEFLESGKNQDPSSIQRYKELALTFKFIKENCLIIADEVDLNLNILQEVNFPSGASETILPGSLDLIKEVYRILATDPNLSPILKLFEDDQGFVAEKKLKELVFPSLADRLIQDYPPLSLLLLPEHYDEMKESLKEYLLGQIDSRLAEGVPLAETESFLLSLNISDDETLKKSRRQLFFLKHLDSLKSSTQADFKEALDAAALSKELCGVVLTVALSKSYNRNYGFDGKGKIIPYLGVHVPAVTEFGNIYEAACYYFQAAITQGITKEFLINYRNKLQEEALNFSEIHRISPENTMEAKHFEELTGLPLFYSWTPRQVEIVTDNLNNDREVVLELYAEAAATALNYHPTLMKCSPIALSQMGAQFVGCAGDLWNKDTFDVNLAESTILQESSIGKIIAKLHSDFKSDNSIFHLVDQPTPAALINKFLDKRRSEGRSRLRALIDVCGMLKRYTNLEVAKEILEQRRLRGEVEAVVTMLKFGDEEAFGLVKRGAEPIRLRDTSRAEIERYGVLIDEVFVYYDELRTTGTDIPLKSDAFAIETFDPNATPLRSTLQGTLRPRGFFRSQNVDFAIEKIGLEGFENYNPESPKACLTSENFFATALRNETRLLKPQLLRSALEQASENYRSMVIQKMAFLASSTNEEDLLKSFQLRDAANWLFVTSFRDSPSELFLNLEREKKASETLKEKLESVKKQFELTCSTFFEPQELAALEAKSQKAEAFFENKLDWKVSTQQDHHLETQVMVENLKETQVDVNVEVQKETQKELLKYSTRVDSPIAKTLPLEKLVNQPKSFFEYKTPAILSFDQLLRRVAYEAPYHEIFPKDLKLTENLSRTHLADYPVFHKVQKSIQFVLLIKKDEQFQTLFIDASEAEMWRSEIGEHRLQDCWLLNLEGKSLNDHHLSPQESKKTVDRALFWAHFFNGDASYLRSNSALIESELKEHFELKCRFLRLKASRDEVQTKVLTTDPIFTRQERELPSQDLKANEVKEKWHNERIKYLSAEEINKLPFSFVRYLTEDRIPHLKRKGYFIYLPPDLFPFVTKAQLSLIPNHRLKYLKTKEQIENIPAERVIWLKGEGLKHLPSAHLDRIHPEEMINLTKEQQSEYQRIMIGKFGLAGFSETVTPVMAKVILPECVPFLNDNCLPYLEDKEQLKNVAKDKYHHLTAAQLHLLPKENWPSIQKASFLKYSMLEKIPNEAMALIQEMNKDWVNDVDARLAAFFSDEQIKGINNPAPIKHLKIDQLRHLNTSLANFIKDDQLPNLAKEHHALIEAITDSRMISLLSNEGLENLKEDQIKLIKDRKTILRLPSKFLGLLGVEQLDLLNFAETKDQKIIPALQYKQFEKLRAQKILTLLPFLNETALREVDPEVISSSSSLAPNLLQKLKARQIQSYLATHTESQESLVKNLTSRQWKNLDGVFISSYFDGKPKSLIKNVPKSRIKDLSKNALLLWYDRDLTRNKMADGMAGFFSALFFPATLLAALISGAFSKKSFRSGFRRVALTPLRLFAKETYYRNLL